MNSMWERSPIAQSPVSVVVLTGQAEGENLKQTLAELQQVLQAHHQPYEVLIPVAPVGEAALQSIVVESSKTRMIVDETVAQGTGSAFKAGLAAAQYPLLFVLPVGYSAQLLPLFLKEIDQVDLVCGAREDKAQGWKWRQFFSSTYQIFGLWMQDPECPVRLYRREIFENIPIQSQGAFAEVEILAKANFQSRLMTEVPVTGASPEIMVKKDFWRVLNNPDFGPPPEQKAEDVKPIFTSQAPEARP